MEDVQKIQVNDATMKNVVHGGGVVGKTNIETTHSLCVD